MANKWKQAKEYLDSELGKAKNLLREKEFSPEAKQDLLKNLSEDEVSLIQKNRRTEAVKKAKESKEKMKTPQLESENHKIDTWKSKKEKLAEWWKEEERPAYINWSKTKIKVLKKELAPGAYVREYQDDGKMPKHLVGEQLFNWKAVLSLGLQDRLPTYNQYKEMWFSPNWWEEHKKAMNKNFKKWDNDLFPGCWDPDYELFYNFGDRTDCWLADGGDVVLIEDYMNHDGYNPEFGFSLRLLQN